MGKNLTAREKFLLEIMSAFIILFMFYILVFKPVNTVNMMITGQKNKAVKILKNYEIRKEQYDKNQSIIKEKQLRLKSITANMYENVDTKKISRDLTKIAKDCNMTPTSIKVTLPEAAEKIAGYGTEADFDYYKSIYSSEVNMTVAGSQEDQWKFLDTLFEKDNKILVRAYDFGGITDDGSSLLNVSMLVYQYAGEFLVG